MMKRLDCKLWLISSILSGLLAGELAIAQVQPDNTLPENSAVTRRGDTIVINRGTQRGRNLFHSFDRFSVPRNRRVSFQDVPATIRNIFARVTGSSPSRIDGRIEVRDRAGQISAANLFLLNPNGILFGEQAALNIGGSFLATTADRIEFRGGFQFGADPQTSPLLTVQVPVGLQMGPAPAAIHNRSLLGLTVDRGHTLALVGGAIAFAGGSGAAGRVELAALGRSATVRLVPVAQGWRLDPEGSPRFADISLSDRATITTSGDQGGAIQMQGRRVTLSGGSVADADASLGAQAGRLRVVATERVELAGVSSTDPDQRTELRNQVYGRVSGETGSLTIETRQLLLRDGAQISTGTSGTGQGVDLTIAASEAVELIGTSADNRYPSGLFARSGPQASGNGGNLAIATRRLTVRNGAQLATDTLGAGNAGNVTITALDSIEVLGRNPDDLTKASGLFAQVGPDASGNGGDLRLHTRRLNLRGGAQISSNTFGAGPAGTIDIHATEAVLVSDTAPIDRDDNISGILVSAERGATGNARQLTLTTPRLTVAAGARISADNFGSGQRSGVAQLNAATVILDRGEINATTGSGQGGNIRLADTHLLVMQNRSRITARAEAAASGGNVLLDAARGFVIAAPDQDNNILASASRGRGGNIRIDARGILGLAERRNSPRTSDIDASSDFGVPGSVIINSPEINPSTSLPELPAAPIRTELAQGCQVEAGPATAAFFNTGRGGVPASPYDPLSSSPILDDLRLPTPAIAPSPPLVEAQGWIKTDRGDILLVAELPASAPVQCHLR